MGGGAVIDHQDPSGDFLRSELRRAVEARQPDRTAMLNRIAANRAGEFRPKGRNLRLVGSALGVTTVLGLGGVAQWALAGTQEEAPATPAAPPAATTPSTPQVTSAVPSPSAGSTPTAATKASSPSTAPTSAAPSTPAVTASLVRGHPGDTKVEKGSLWSEGGLGGTGQSIVTLRLGADLTELTLDIRVPLTPGLTAGSGTTDVPGGAVTVSVEQKADAIVYHYVLGAGTTMTAGTYAFTATYGGGVRDTADDTYEAYARSVERKDIHIYGNFLAKD
jgi:hypothetical protein